MANTNTKIEWTDTTWSPVTGCTKVSAGCKHCYGERIAKRFWGERKFTDVQTHADRLDQPLHWKKPRRVFVNSMSDLFHGAVTWRFIIKVMAVIEKCPQHQFQILTKRPERMAKLFEDVEPPKNVWLGVSCEDQETADERIPILLQVPAAVRFVSCEPLLEDINLHDHLFYDDGPACCDGGTPESVCGCHGAHQILNRDPGIDWIIVGGESGHGARPTHPDWARSIRDQCQAAGVSYFFKQWGEWAPTKPACFCKVTNSRYSHHSIDLLADGSKYDPTKPDDWPRSTSLYRVGKKAAGRELDGRTWDEYPS